MKPEEQARATIDEYLGHAGWDVQDREEMNLYGSPMAGVAVREAHLKTGFADYLLFVDGKALGVIEAKKAGVPFTTDRDGDGRAAVHQASLFSWES